MLRNVRAILYIAILSFSTTTAHAEDVAGRFVSEMQLGQNFSQIMQGASSHTQTYMNIVCIMGAEQGSALMKEAIATSARKYQPQWDRNLAAAWKTVLSEEEMRSLLSLKQDSPFLPKFNAGFPAAGAKMQASSTNLMQKALVDAMAEAWPRAAAERAADPAAAGCKEQ